MSQCSYLNGVEEEKSRAPVWVEVVLWNREMSETH